MSISLCGTSVGNTGVIDCDVAPGVPELLLVWNGSKAITDISTPETFQAFLEANSKLSKNDPNKVFVFPVIQDIADKTEADTTATLNQGFSTVIREGKAAYDFKIFVGISTVGNLRKFNGQVMKTMMIDKNKRGWGVRSGANFVGQRVKIKVSGLRYATGQAIEEGVSTMSVSYLDNAELNESAAFGEIASTAGIIGLIDVPLVETANHASNVYYVTGRIPTAELGSYINIYDSVGQLLDNASLWTAKTGTTFGVTLPITSVADNPANGGVAITFDSTAFAALAPGAKIRLNLASPATLDAADIQGFEGLYIDLTK